MKLVTPVILLIASLGIFFGYVDPNYKGAAPSDGSEPNSSWSIEALSSELQNYNDVRNNAIGITSTRDELINKKATISQASLDKLEVFLPSNVDNIRLIIEINRIAAKKGLSPKNISFSEQSAGSAGSTQSYGTLNLKFTVKSTYDNFLSFLQDLEKNLRLVDITNITFNSNDDGLYDFNVALNTYWLK